MGTSIENGATLPNTAVVEGVEKVMPITSAEDKAQRRLEVTGLIRNKAELETMSMDDLYNNLKVYEPEVKRMSSSNYGLISQSGVAITAIGGDNFARECEAQGIRLQEQGQAQEGMCLAEEGPNYALMAYSSSSLTRGNFMPLKPDLSFIGLDEFVNKPVVENKKSDKEVSKLVRKFDDSLIIEDWVSDGEEENIEDLLLLETSKRRNTGNSSHDDESKPSSNDGKNVDEDPRKDSEFNVVGGKTSIELPFDLNMPALEDYSIFEFSRDDEDDDVVANMNNLDTTI
ncbi:hypothetical protein Tco_1098861 [Tanacetum coccineum]